MPEIMNTDFLFGSQSVDIYVHPDDDTCGENSPCYSTIQDGISGAVDGSIVKIAKGIYTESLILNSPITVTLHGGWNDTFSSADSEPTVIKNPEGRRRRTQAAELGHQAIGNFQKLIYASWASFICLFTFFFCVVCNGLKVEY